VQVANGDGDLCRVESRTRLVKARHVAQVHEELAAADKAHHEEDLLVRLEHVLHADQEGVVRLEQDVLLKLGALNLVVVDDHVFAQRLHRVVLAIVLLFYEEYLSEGAAADDLDEVETLKVHLRVIVLGVNGGRGFAQVGPVNVLLSGVVTYVFGNVCTLNLRIELFALLAETFLRHHVLAVSQVLLASFVLLQLCCVNFVDGQILTDNLVVKILQTLLDSEVLLGDEAVVIVVFDVDNELLTSFRGGEGIAHEVLDFDGAFDLLVLDVVSVPVCD
jgi:hypothetical protein